MPVSVTMPRLGESVTEGTVTRWLKQEGDRVEADEPLLEVSTDKVDTEIPAPAAGVLARIVVHEDETAEVGSELAVISGDGDGEAGGGGAAAQTAEAGRAGDDRSQTATRAEAAEPRAAEPRAAESQTAESQTAQHRAAEPAAEPQATPSAAAPEAAGPADADGGAAGGGQTTSVTMPALGESVTEGTVTRWLKSVGDTVEADEPLLEVSTDKVDTEIPAPASGKLREIKIGEDETAQVGAELAVIGAGAAPAGARPEREPVAPPAQQAARPEAERSDQQASQQAAPEAASAPAQSAPDRQTEQRADRQTAQPADRQAERDRAAEPAAAGATTAGTAPTVGDRSTEGDGSRPQGAGAAAKLSEEDFGGYVTPLVRRLAAEHDVELTSVAGTGVGGRIRKQDVLEAAERKRAEAAKAAKAAESTRQAQPAAQQAPARPEPSPLRGRTEKMSRLRSIIAKRMVESLQTSAQLTTVVEVDVTRIARLRQQAKDQFAKLHGAKLSFLPFFALATVEALRAHPVVNASIDMEAGTVSYHDAEHLGIAVDTEKGLMVPVIRNAGDLNLVGLAKRIADLAERTRTMKIEPDELSGGTFTLTNTGSRGALFDTPIINQPQVGILGTGAVVKRAVVVDHPDLGETVVPRSMVYLALSYDHRLVDGADAARFLTSVKGRLEAGAFEADLGLS